MYIFVEGNALKMIFKAFLILIVTGVSLCDTEDCAKNAHEECNYERFPQDYPDTVEELIQDCSIVQEMISCYIKLYEKCSGFEAEILRLEQLLKYTEAGCKEESHLFQVISRNIGCATPAARSLGEACNWENFRDEDFDAVMSLLEPFLQRSGYECGEAVSRITCAAQVISIRCGSELKEVVTDILEHTDWNYQQCSEEILEELFPFKQALEIIIIKKEMLGNSTTNE